MTNPEGTNITEILILDTEINQNSKFEMLDLLKLKFIWRSAFW